MKKIPDKYENPIDTLNIDLMDKTTGFFKSLNTTPNGITTLSLIFGLISIYFLYHRKFIFFAITYYTSYLFDCLDGHYARKYKMTSTLGDFYDHIKDIFIIFLIFIVVIFYFQITKLTKIIFTLSILSMFFLMSIHLGCQEKIYPKNESLTLNFTKKLCLGDPKQTIKITRFFGCGTAVLFMIFAIFLVIKKIKI